jgi:hypothetical protein
MDENLEILGKIFKNWFTLLELTYEKLHNWWKCKEMGLLSKIIKILKTFSNFLFWGKTIQFDEIYPLDLNFKPFVNEGTSHISLKKCYSKHSLKSYHN